MNQDLTLHSKQEGKWAVNTLYFLSSSKNTADSKPPNVAFVSTEKFHSIYQAKGT